MSNFWKYLRLMCLAIAIAQLITYAIMWQMGIVVSHISALTTALCWLMAEFRCWVGDDS